MATLKSKRKKEAQIEDLSKEVENSAPVEETVEEPTVSPYLNEAEQTALAEQREKDIVESQKVSTEKMQSAVEVVQEQFHLCDRGFSVNGFSDKGSKCQVSLSNGDFDLVVTIKDSEKFGII